MIISDAELLRELKERIIPFWRSMRDNENGGYYGWVDFDLGLKKDAVKGCILNSRILWFFSQAYSLLGSPALLSDAKHAYDFMTAHMLDNKHGGVFWSVDYKGNAEDDSKHTYNQAFAIYALSAYYKVSGDKTALDRAIELFETIEEKCTDEGGYLEQFDRTWNPADNQKLSENGVIAGRTMNTLLHVLEAYTGLYDACKYCTDPTPLERVGKRLEWIVNEAIEKVFNPELNRLEVFFDYDMHSLIDLHSYGHDIETAWLLDRACDVLGDDELTARERKVSAALEDNILSVAMTDHGMPNECENGVVNQWRVWWVQAESVVGFTNAYQKRPEREDFRKAALAQWDYIQKYIVDTRDGGEWYWRVAEDGTPDKESPIVEPWKCPYHNGRMCLELLSRKG